MVIISYSSLRTFIIKHAESKDAINNWYRLTSQADWSNFHELKDMFGAVDSIGNDRYVFNIKGNSYRLICLIFFDVRTVYIRFVGSHAEYDKLKNCSLV